MGILPIIMRGPLAVLNMQNKNNSTTEQNDIDDQEGYKNTNNNIDIDTRGYVLPLIKNIYSEGKYNSLEEMTNLLMSFAYIKDNNTYNILFSTINNNIYIQHEFMGKGNVVKTFFSNDKITIFNYLKTKLENILK